ncbi:fibroblast growth factor 19-like [Tiliqua scincoides]|uniref:fibroblast growth factor 19-like n=1 Tax=Tiliqua scincoides TaxID=71010 RepID=UPI003461C12B
MVARSLPLIDAGPHVSHGWGEPIRLRHLYSKGRLYLSIFSDGRVGGSATQDLNSLLQITSVAVGTVAFKGVLSSRYLCMEDEGRLQGRLIYSAEDCSFEEEIRLGGYNAYKSKKYGVLVSLSSARQRQQVKGKDSHPLSHFLPIITTMPVESTDFGEYRDSGPSFESRIFNSRLDNDSPDPLGFTSDIAVQSPSFEK